MLRVSAQLSWGVGNQDPLHCSRWRAVARIIDTWALTFVILNNTVATSALLHRAKRTSPHIIIVPALGFVLWSLLQWYASRRWPDAYYRNHTWILLFNRAIRLPMLSILLLETRARCRDPTLPTQLRAYLSMGRPFSNDSLELFTGTLGASGSMLLLMHASAAPLPFIPQLVMQAVSVIVMLLCQSHPATLLIDRSPLRDTARSFCTHLNALFAASSSAFGVYCNHDVLQATCARHSTHLLVIFMQLYFGFALPVCFSYRLQSYLLLLLQATGHGRGSSSGSSSSSGGNGRGHGGRSSGRGRSSSASGWSSTGSNSDVGSVSGSSVSSPFAWPQSSVPVSQRDPFVDEFGWPHLADTPSRLFADMLVLTYLVPACWVCAVVLRPAIDALAWPIHID